MHWHLAQRSVAVARTSCAEHDVCARGVGGLAACGRLGPARGAARPEARCAARRRHGEDHEFTVIGNDGKRVSLSKGEKERVFIDAIQSYYFDGRQVLSDADFDLLKEDLAWEGSEYAVLSRNETRFLGAMGAYSRGEEPIMSDDEFDALKASLKAQGSIVACSTEPRCFLDTGICSVAFCAETNRWVEVPCELYDVASMARGA